MEINEIIRESRNAKQEIYRNLIRQEAEINSKLALLIYKTPTGETRNELTDINILFQKIMDDYENLYKLLTI